MAIIRIHDLNFRSIIGAHSWERTNKQDVIVNLTIEYDASKASRSDRLKDALDYEALALKVGRIVERSRYQLLEKLASRILQGIMVDSASSGPKSAWKNHMLWPMPGVFPLSLKVPSKSDFFPCAGNRPW